MALNKDLYERYLAKKAKKLGVSVESLRGSSSQMTSSQPVEQSQTENVVQSVDFQQSEIPMLLWFSKKVK